MTQAHPTAPARRSRVAALPAAIEPMLAVSAPLPIDPEHWAFEFKWDGVRCISYWDGHRLKMLSRNQIVITHRYPELAGFGAAIGRKNAILDGEIIALDRAGRPSFAELQKRMHVNDPSPALVRQTPASYIVFDVLYLDGRETMPQTYAQRRALLESLGLSGAHWQISPSRIGDGEALVAAAKATHMEGVVAKLLDSPYLPGRRSPAWRKIKTVFGQEFVIGGWLPQVGSAGNRVGALLLGAYEQRQGGDPALRYAGRVGTGFSDETHARLIPQLKRLAIAACPFADPIPGRGVQYVKPKLVAEVQYRRWPDSGMVQQASFKGLRTDKSAAEVVREINAGAIL